MKQEQIKIMQNAEQIKAIEKGVEEMKKKNKEEVTRKARERYEGKIMDNEKARDELEEQILRLEQRERELMGRLSNTQMFHQLAVEDLDRIINNEEPVSLKIPKAK